MIVLWHELYRDSPRVPQMLLSELGSGNGLKESNNTRKPSAEFPGKS